MRRVLEDSPLCFELRFSYSQFMVFDGTFDRIGRAWTNQHAEQGFARCDRCIACGTLVSHGVALVRAFPWPLTDPTPYDRAICTNLAVASGDMAFDAPEGQLEERVLIVRPGWYELSLCQVQASDESILVDVFVAPGRDRLHRSRILKADRELRPAYPLLESSDEA